MRGACEVRADNSPLNSQLNDASLPVRRSEPQQVRTGAAPANPASLRADDDVNCRRRAV